MVEGKGRGGILEVRRYCERMEGQGIDEVLNVCGNFERNYRTLARKSLHSHFLSYSFYDPFMDFSQEKSL